jgi:hypothetical protein
MVAFILVGINLLAAYLSYATARRRSAGPGGGVVSSTVIPASKALCARHGAGADQGDIAMDGTLPIRLAAFWQHSGLGSINKVLKNDVEMGYVVDPRRTGP